MVGLLPDISILTFLKSSKGVKVTEKLDCMDKEPNSVVSNILFFSANLFLFLLPIFIGFVVYKEYGAEPVVALAFVGYLPVVGLRMSKVVKAILKNEVV